MPQKMPCPSATWRSFLADNGCQMTLVRIVQKGTIPSQQRKAIFTRGRDDDAIGWIAMKITWQKGRVQQDIWAQFTKFQTWKVPELIQPALRRKGGAKSAFASQKSNFPGSNR